VLLPERLQQRILPILDEHSGEALQWMDGRSTT
jgi:hypothetical protein